MIPLSPVLLVQVAQALAGNGEDHPGRSRGRLVHRFLREAGVEGGAAGGDVPWHTAFVHYAGYWSHFDQRSATSSWPLPISASCHALALFAAQAGVLAEHPVEGDLFLLWGPAEKAFIRAGIVVELDGTGENLNGEPWTKCVTIEGDTNPVRAARGGETLRHARLLSAERGDRFVRWTALTAGARKSVRIDAEVPDEERDEERDDERTAALPPDELRRAA